MQIVLNDVNKLGRKYHASSNHGETIFAYVSQNVDEKKKEKYQKV